MFDALGILSLGELPGWYGAEQINVYQKDMTVKTAERMILLQSGMRVSYASARVDIFQNDDVIKASAGKAEG